MKEGLMQGGKNSPRQASLNKKIRYECFALSLGLKLLDGGG